MADIQITDYSPSADLAQTLGSDGTTPGKPLLRWKDVVAAGLNDGQGNKISMTELIQKIKALP